MYCGVISMKKIGVIAKYFGLFVLFYVLCRAYVVIDECKTLGFGLLFALIMCGNGYAILATYLPAYLLANLHICSIYVAISTLAIGIILISISKRKKVPSWVYYISAFASQCIMIFINIDTPRIAFVWLFCIVLGLFMVYVCNVAINVIKYRHSFVTILPDEKIAFGILVLGVAIGLATINNIYILPLTVVSICSIFVATYYMPIGYNYIFAIIFGLGNVIITKNANAISIFTLYAIACSAFKTNTKLFSLIAVILTDIAFGFYIGKEFMLSNLISVLIGIVFFYCLPNKYKQHINDMFCNSHDGFAARSIINRTREDVCKKLQNVSQVFDNMNVAYRKMIQGTMKDEDAKQLIGQELVSKVCAHCPERNKCMRVDGKFTLDVFEELLDAGMKRGKVTLLDIPPFLTGKCNNVNVILNTLNNLVKNYKNYTNMIKNSDSSKLLIADNLAAVSDMMSNLSSDISSDVVFDTTLEESIREALLYSNILIYEVVVHVSDINNKVITLVLPSQQKNYNAITKCLSKVCGASMGVVNINSKLDKQIVTIKQKPNYDIVFGVSSYGKDGVLQNGDSHTVTKINDDTYVIALCDGMGTGKGAHTTSTLALGLVENFYRAGFDSDMILNTVNKLLSIGSNENYSALDLCTINLRKCTCDFVKLGAPFGIVKTKNDIQVIEGSGLPIGVLEEMKPHLVNKLVNPFDTIIMFSDGILDAFGSKQEVINYVSTITSTNPQTITDSIMDTAVDICKGQVQDDLTVLACRIYPTQC